MRQFKSAFDCICMHHLAAAQPFETHAVILSKATGAQSRECALIGQFENQMSQLMKSNKTKS